MYERRRETIERAHDFSESLELHQQVYRAIRARQPEEARAAMREHIVRAQQAFALEESEEHRPLPISRTAGNATSGRMTGGSDRQLRECS